ncbi:hypothetical protein LAWI1_G008473 [Lachnellula willkommii]|uniref:Alpha-galactosidase A n=1 Tax=Lachnellula willkommii TaxID=215461 RepID=A0A559M0E0_9HELO|nr:hypothetical protein LAWI1_G008473 [Lachnellula willkommii]
MAESKPIQVLQLEVDPETSGGEFRILVDGTSVKYLTIDPGLYDADDMCFTPLFVPQLPPLPPGDWNVGRISQDPIDHLALAMGKKLRSNVYETTSPDFKSTVVAKFARFPWEIPLLDRETAVYECIFGHGIGPRFLAHLSEGGRVTGFLMEKIVDFRHATLDDLPLCQDTLSRLHRLGIRHGDTNKHNFLIHDGKATMVDFDCGERSLDEKVLEAEARGLEVEFQDMSGRGGVGVAFVE